MNRKEYRASFKNMNDDGTGSMVFATKNVIDHDQDVLVHGVIERKTVKLMGAHEWKEPNIGMAVIREDGDELVADFKFYLEMESAAEWYKSVKANHENHVPQEASFGFNTLDSERGTFQEKSVRFLKKLDVFEVSFVTKGAGLNTRTLYVKSADEEAHDETDEQKNLRFADHAERVTLDVGGLIDRSKALAALRSKEGRTLSNATRTRLSSLLPKLTEAMTDLQGLLAETDVQTEAVPELGKSFDADAMYAEFLATTTRQAGHLR